MIITRFFITVSALLTCSCLFASELRLTQLYGPFIWSDGSTSLATNKGLAEFDLWDCYVCIDNKEYIETNIGLIPLSEDLLKTLHNWLLDRQNKRKKEKVLANLNLKKSLPTLLKCQNFKIIYNQTDSTITM